uniref:DUF4220 domain-containing protein n=1 Tax=Oryza glumipatula TaxID=40148 RepID=A0A0D9ZGQ0_9ORYZ
MVTSMSFDRKNLDYTRSASMNEGRNNVLCASSALAWDSFPEARGTIRSNIDKQKRDKLKKKEEKAGDEGRRAKSSALSTKDPDYALLQAHANFSACKAALVDISSAEESTLQEWSWPNTWIVLQREVSLLYNIMYTKAGVIHTWHGYLLSCDPNSFALNKGQLLP